MRAHEEEQSYTTERKILVGISFKSKFLPQDSNEITLRVTGENFVRRAFEKISTMSKKALFLYSILKHNIIRFTPPHFIKTYHSSHIHESG